MKEQQELARDGRVSVPLDWTLVSAVNSVSVLNSCLLRSGVVESAREVILQKGYASAAVAYNSAIARAASDLIVIAHQDVYFPEGWLFDLKAALEELGKEDPKWGVLGVWGVREGGDFAGHVYCGATRKELGARFDGVIPVQTLDEVVLIVRRSSGLLFDEGLGGYHFYGSDICLEAARRKLGCYVIPAFCVHNTKGYRFLPLAFWKGYWFMRRKWRELLPVVTPCITISYWMTPFLRWNLARCISVLRGRHRQGGQVEDPRVLVH